MLSARSSDHPRKSAISAIQSSLPDKEWRINLELCQKIRKKINGHAIHDHPILEVLKSGQVSLEMVQLIHLEYRHAIVQIFTDALLMAQFQSRQLEKHLKPGSKIPARFLLALNILDEFGFKPGKPFYQGTPDQAHYPLYEVVLGDLKITDKRKKAFRPSTHASHLKLLLENSFASYSEILILLAVAEEQVMIFSPALRESIKKINLNTDSGYYFVHGSSKDEESDAHDDDHEDDLWIALAQACSPETCPNLEKIALGYADAWKDFWDFQLKNIRQSLQYQSIEGCEFNSRDAIPSSEGIPVE